MELLNIIKNDELQDKLIKYSLENKIDEEKIICSLVYKFAKNLPYSMDYKDEKYVPVDIYNFSSSIKNNSIFKYHDSLYKKLISWGDSFKSGILLQVCFIFQKMLNNEFPNNYKLDEQYYYNWGINNMTENEQYNRCFFEILNTLPTYYKMINSTESQIERRQILDKIYMIIKNKIGQKVGGYKITEVIGNVEKIKEFEPTINWSPYRDLEMVYSFEYMNCYDINCEEFINDVKNKRKKLTIE